MTTPETAPVEVTQADRDAVADLLDMRNGSGGEPAPYTYTVSVREGIMDTNDLVQAFARHRLTPRQDGLRETLPVSVVVLQNCIGAIIEAVKPLVAFHETGGHEGDGSDAQLKKIREVLSTPIGKIAALSDISPLANDTGALREAAYNLAISAGALVIATDNWMVVRAERKKVLRDLQKVEAALSPDDGEGK